MLPKEQDRRFVILFDRQIVRGPQIPVHCVTGRAPIDKKLNHPIALNTCHCIVQWRCSLLVPCRYIGPVIKKDRSHFYMFLVAQMSCW